MKVVHGLIISFAIIKYVSMQILPVMEKMTVEILVMKTSVVSIYKIIILELFKQRFKKITITYILVYSITILCVFENLGTYLSSRWSFIKV